MFDNKKYQQKYRFQHREKLKKYKKTYYLSHREEIKVKGKIYRLAHPKRIKARDKTYYLTHHKKIRTRQKTYYPTHHREMLENMKKYRQSLLGKEAKRRGYAKRKCFGFIPLNKYFKGCDGHHINSNYVIYIPQKLHRSIFHSIISGIGMKKINKEAFKFLNKKEKNEG